MQTLVKIMYTHSVYSMVGSFLNKVQPAAKAKTLPEIINGKRRMPLRRVERDISPRVAISVLIRRCNNV